VIAALKDYGISVSIYDPLAKAAAVAREYQLELLTEVPTQQYDALVLGVAHTAFLTMDFASLRQENSILYDVKGVLTTTVDGRL
jgi:UDP-N-acetyl-D-galactosamine dehydrogenase